MLIVKKISFVYILCVNVSHTYICCVQKILIWCMLVSDKLVRNVTIHKLVVNVPIPLHSFYPPTPIYVRVLSFTYKKPPDI